jgi:ketosteroid isomerase-like protein
MEGRSIRTVAALSVLVLGTAAMVLPVRGQAQMSAAQSLAEAERAFSRLSGRIGHVAAFLAYFADDVVTFQPGPATGKERLRETASRMPVPPAVKLDWEPWFAGAARSGDLGYTTGPSVFSDAATGKVLRTGWYYSVWKRDANGWRVAADIGIESPPVGELRPRTIEFDAALDGTGLSGTREGVVGFERELAKAVGDVGLAKAYAPYLTPTSRVHRDGSAPVVGGAAIEAYLAGLPRPAGCRVVDAGVSKAGDFAFSVGECESTGATAPGRAGFLHAWTNGARGWRLAADVVTR